MKDFLLRNRKLLIGGLCLAIFAGLAFVWFIGGQLTAPCPRKCGELPNDLPGETVQFTSASGFQLHGWFIPGVSKSPTVILLHGVRGSRMDMLGRARFLHLAGYHVLLFDFQAHGESPGAHITFGYLESKDVRAAVEFVRARNPNGKIAVDGVSLGGAAALLANPPLPVNAMILEMVYPTIEQATADRLAMRFSAAGKIFAPLLTWQLRPRLGIGVDDLRPINALKNVAVPKFFIAGTNDRRTTFTEAKELFAAAIEPKQFWPVAEADHCDLHVFARPEFEKRVLEFLKANLQ